MRKLAVFLVLLLGCATTLAMPREVWYVRVANMNWNASRLEFMCVRGAGSFWMRGLVMNDVTQERRRYNCEEYRLTVSGLGMRHTYRYNLLVEPGDVWCVELHGSISLMKAWKCGLRAEEG